MSQELISFKCIKRRSGASKVVEKKSRKEFDTSGSDQCDSSPGKHYSSQSKSPVAVNTESYTSGDATFTSIKPKNTSSCRGTTKIASWNLPQCVVDWFHSKGIENMFEWQVECLLKTKILEGNNLVFSAPTSAGKSLVGDILMMKKAIENKQKSMLILPFVSVTREKMLTLQSMLKGTGVRVGGFMGGTQPPGGFAAIDIGICTIEKANSLINKFIEEDKLSTLSTVIVDELHLLGDEHRGYLLELLLTKLHFISTTKNYNIQIIGMSATLPNVENFARWLNTEAVQYDFRPVLLTEKLKIGNQLYNSNLEMCEQFVRKYNIPGDTDDVVHIVLDTVANKHGILIFCATRKACESLAKKIAEFVREFGKSSNDEGNSVDSIRSKLRSALCGEKLKQLLLHLKRLPFKLDKTLCDAIKFGVAYHHAGLSMEERDVIEDGFRNGVIKVLVATSTLCSGVNLPARRVIISSPLTFTGFVKERMDISTYQQMVGRAGRKGIDTEGESFLICNEAEQDAGKELISSKLGEVHSCLLSQSNEHNLRLTKALLEVITLRIACTKSSLLEYLKYSFLAQDYDNFDELANSVIAKAVDYLNEYGFIKVHSNGTFYASRLGEAVVSSAINPQDGLYFVDELQKASTGFILNNDLHILYQVITPHLSYNLDPEHWEKFGRIWDQLDKDSINVGVAVGIDQRLLSEGFNKNYKEMERMFGKEKVSNHRRFYSALALSDVIQEMSMSDVSLKYKIPKGQLQTMQHNVGTFASMITVFCNKLGWTNLEILISQFHSRLHFGIQKELMDLMKLSCLNAGLARCLYKSGFDSVTSIAQSNFRDIRESIKNFEPFKISPQASNRIWISGQSCSMNIDEIAKSALEEARSLINKIVGTNIDWNRFDGSDSPQLDRRCFPLEQPNDLRSDSTGEDTASSRESSPGNNGTKDDLFVIKSVENCENLKFETTEADLEWKQLLPILTAIKAIEVSKEDKVFDLFVSSFKRNSVFSMFIQFEDVVKKPSKFIAGIMTNPSYRNNAIDGIILEDDHLLVSRIHFHFNDENVFCFETETSLKLLQRILYTLFDTIKTIRVFDFRLTYKALRLLFNFDRQLMSNIQWIDPKVCEWLIDPEEHEPSSIEVLISKYFNELPFREDKNERKRIAVDCAYVTFVTEKVKRELSTKNLLSTLLSYEIPALTLLIEAEIVGVGIDKQYIEECIPKWSDMLENLKSEAYALANHAFDLNCPTQVAYVLYKERDLLSKGFHLLECNPKRGRRREKSELSKNLRTAKSILEKFKDIDKLPGVIVKWRRLKSMLKKSVKPIRFHMRFDKNLGMDRVSGKFDYWTLTGRIHMSDPNLLCIPRDFDASVSADTKLMVSFRKALIARAGYCLISADFQQLELRILAHLSGDPRLIRELSDGKDIFKCIAAGVTNKDITDITFDERQQAKAICYGIIYGLGKHELAKKLGVVEDAAEEFKENFFKTYPSILKFKEETIATCESEGYVESIEGRRRYLPNINNRSIALKRKAERQAFNTKIQGSASDLVKMSMINVNAQLSSANVNAQLVLQIHDELLFEVEEQNVHQFEKCLNDAIKLSDAKLKVDLPVKLKKGLNWAEMTEL